MAEARGGVPVRWRRRGRPSRSDVTVDDGDPEPLTWVSALAVVVVAAVYAVTLAWVVVRVFVAAFWR